MIKLTDSVFDEIRKHGEEVFTVAAGKRLKIEITPAGEEILDVVVPEGKVWQATIRVQITEKNA